MSGATVGVGARSGVSVDEVVCLVTEALREAGLTGSDVTALATLEARAAEPGIAGAAGRLGVPLRAYGAEELAAVSVPHPSRAPLSATGTASVAEAAALLAAGAGAALLVPKRKSARVTCAIARSLPVRPNEVASAVRLLPQRQGYIAGQTEPRTPPLITRRRPWIPTRTLMPTICATTVTQRYGTRS
ncbi:cobalamin biosynthesis protein [Streptomyces sp. NPDC001774]